MPEALMKHLIGKFWYASPKKNFLEPGLYHCNLKRNKRIFALKSIEQSAPQIVKFPEVNMTYAKDQPEYRPLPCYRKDDGEMICCWKFSLRDRIKILFTGVIWHTVLIFNQPLQPQLILVDKPKMKEI